MNSKSQQRGTTLIVTVTTLATLSVMAAFTLQRVTPKFHEANQTAGWQEGRLAAEAGIDAAMGDLLRNATASGTGTWTGWRQNNGGVIGPVVTGVLDVVNTLLSLLLGSPVSEPIFLDNLRVVTASGLPTEVDVQLWALQPTATSPRRWFRIRSMATCSLAAAAYKAPSKLDNALRRLNLRSVRSQLKQEDVGVPMTVPTPSASRVIEVLVEPLLAFELAIWTNETLKLGTSGTWNVDSYDSRDTLKSNPDGSYPGKSSPKVQNNGNIANNAGRPAGSLYGTLIYANGSSVRGSVATNGGDDPHTSNHESVYGPQNLDPARIRSDFCREMKPVGRPPGVAIPILLPLGLFAAGSETAPVQYLVYGNLGAFTVLPPALGKGALIIMVNGNLDVGGAGINIPPNVTCQIYVRGNINFHNHAINSGGTSSKRPGQLQIYGEDTGAPLRTVKADGTASICAAFYGPTYDVQLQTDVTWCGAVGARSFEMSGGGSGGFHYDEALGEIGPTVSFRIARYVEDVRE